MAEKPIGRGDGQRVWDEYDWERFLQLQDRKTEKYMELLERYLDHPNRDQIIAREMGWKHLLEEAGREAGDKSFTVDFQTINHSLDAGGAGEADDEEEDDEDFEEYDEEEDEGDEEKDDDAVEQEEEEESELESYTAHPLYRLASALNVMIEGFFDSRSGVGQHPAGARLSACATLASVKLAAALSDDDIDELGMTIAYLKRALKAITNALDAAALCRRESLLNRAQAGDLEARIFQVRDGIVSLMGQCRIEWRRRHGQNR